METNERIHKILNSIKMDSEAATGAAVHPGGAHNRDTDELLDPVLFSDNNDSFKLKTVPAFRCV